MSDKPEDENEIDKASDYILAFVGIAVPFGAAIYVMLHFNSGWQTQPAAIVALTTAAIAAFILVQIRPVRRFVLEAFHFLTAPFS